VIRIGGVYMNLFLKLFVVSSLLCNQIVAEDDPFAIFKLPSKKATVHHVKKDGKEFICIKGNDLDDYKIANNNDGISLKIRDHSVKAKADLSSNSTYLKQVSSSINKDGSNIEFNLKGKPGFKVYRRKSGLVIAMGPGYREVSEDLLESLETEVSSSSSLDRELDALISESMNGSQTPAPKSELDSIIEDLESGSSPAKVDAESDLDRIIAEADSDLYGYEQKKIEQEMKEPVKLEKISLSKIDDKIQVLIKTNKAVRYEQISSDSVNQVNIDLPNTVITKNIGRVNVSKSEGLIKAIEYKQLRGPYPSSRVTIHMSDSVEPRFSQKSNNIFVNFMLGDYIDREIQRILAEVEIDFQSASKLIAKTDYKKKFFCVDSDDYLAKPTSFVGKRMSMQVFDANILDVLRMIQQVGNINLVVSDKVKGTINVSLKNIPWDQALSTILQNAGLACVRQGSVMRISYLEDLKNERKVAAEARDAYKNLEPLKIMVAKYTLSDSKDVEKKLSVLLSKRGKIAVDATTRTIVIYDMQDVVDKADKLMSLIDVNSTVVKM
jgi:hypothetical protein